MVLHRASLHWHKVSPNTQTNHEALCMKADFVTYYQNKVYSATQTLTMQPWSPIYQ